MKDIINGLYWTRPRASDFFTMTEGNIDFKHGLLDGVQKKTITTRLPGGVPYQIVMSKDLEDLLRFRLIGLKPGASGLVAAELFSLD